MRRPAEPDGPLHALRTTAWVAGLALLSGALLRTAAAAPGAAVGLPNGAPRTAGQAGSGAHEPTVGTKPAASLLFADFDDEQPYPGKEALKQLLLQVPGGRYDLADTNKNNRPICRFGGLMRLNLPWPEDAALRFSFLDARDVHWWLWNGNQGVRLQFCNEFHDAWAAYGAVRQGNPPTSKELALWAVDGDRYRRSGAGTLEIHYRQGHLVLMRGDLRLLSVPFAGQPQEVYLEGDGLVRGLAMVPSTGGEKPAGAGVAAGTEKVLQDHSAATGKNADPTAAVGRAFLPDGGPLGLETASNRRWPSNCLPADKPAELEWTEPPKGVTFQRLPDGCVELRAGEKAPAGQAATKLDQPGFYEVLAQVDDAGPGTGIFLGGLDGKMLCRLAVFHHHETGRKIFGPLAIWAGEYDRGADVRHVVSYLGPQHWLRLTAGAGVARCWTSGDGIYWSPVTVATDSYEGACRQVGVYCLAGDRPRAIRLRRLVARRFECFSSLVSAGVLQRARMAGPGASAGDVDAWEIDVAKSWPRELPFGDWWKACALATLADGPKAPLGQPIFQRLQDRVLQDPAELPRAFRFLVEAAQFYAYDYNVSLALERAYRRVGATMIQSGQSAAFTAVSQAMLRSPLWPELRLAVFNSQLLREELWAKMGQDRWPEVADLCRKLEFWNRVGFHEGELPPWSDQVRHMVFWAHTQASGRVPPEAVSPPGTPPRRWKHPLASEVGKDAYNLISEFHAAIDAQAYQEACQIVSTTAETQALGLVPDRKDPRLAMTLPLAIGLAMRDTPELKRAMQEKFGAVGGLRFRQAAAGGNRAAVTDVALRFPGTEAAADAHRWLGDRDLAGGRFTEALAEYAGSLESSPAAAQEAIHARRRLAAAMLGQDLGPRVTFPVQLGDRRFTAEEFEALVQQLRQSHRTGVAAGANEAAPARTGEERSAAFGSAKQRGFRGAKDDNPTDIGPIELRPALEYESPRLRRHWSMPDRGVDWAGRQTAVLAAAGQLFVSNQVDQMAFDLETGQLQWAQRGAADERQQQWPLVPMRPVPYRDAILVRRLAEDGPELACLAAADGRLLWSVKPDKCVLSEPLLLGQTCCVLTEIDEGSGRLGLGLAAIDVESGQVRSRTNLAEFQDLWSLRIPCQATLSDGRLVATVGGCVLACRPGSGLEWIRRQLWMPPPSESSSEAAAWHGQIHQPPLVAGGRVFATQPGVWGIDCLDLATGRLLWQRAAGDLVRLVGLVDDRLVVEAGDGLFAVDAATGNRLWTHEVHHPTESRVLPGQRVIEFLQTVPQPEGAAPQLALALLDVDNGKIRRRTLLKGPVEKEPLWGPLATSGGRQWLLFAPASNPAKRSVLELTRKDAEPR